MESKKKKAMYLRVSSRERALYGYGLDSQYSKNLDYMKLFEYDTEDIEVYKDDGISGKDLNRPEMQRMIENIKKEKIELVIIYKLDRIARNVIDIYNLINMFMEYKVQLIAVMDHIDINTANGRMLVGILAIIAQWERECDSERTLDGLQAMIEKGKYPHPGSPFGWDKDKDKYLHINEEQSGILNYLGDMVMQGYYLNEINAELKKKFNISKKAETVRKWLLRIENIGIINYRGKIYNDIVPAIMTEKKRSKIEKALNRRTPKIDKSKYYFAGMVYCCCGSKADHKVTNKKHKNYYYYECSDCYKRINQDWILEQTLNEIFSHASKIQISDIENKYIKSIEELNTKINNLYISYSQDEIDVKSYAFSISKLQVDKNELKAKVSGLFIDTKKQFMNKSDITKKAFIQQYVARVTVDLDLKLVVELKYKTIHR